MNQPLGSDKGICRSPNKDTPKFSPPTITFTYLLGYVDGKESEEKSRSELFDGRVEARRKGWRGSFP